MSEVTVVVFPDGSYEHLDDFDPDERIRNGNSDDYMVVTVPLLDNDEPDLSGLT